MMTDVIIVVVLTVILGAVLLYMKKEKEKGVTCIGCPDAEVCAKRRNGQSCGNTDNEK